MFVLADQAHSVEPKEMCDAHHIRLLIFVSVHEINGALYSLQQRVCGAKRLLINLSPRIDHVDSILKYEDSARTDEHVIDSK